MDWFPRMRAMSLTADDGEGEQSDYRNLQAQLDSTNRLVKNLSKQLTDLKEQVGRPLTYLVCLGYCGIIIASGGLMFMDSKGRSSARALGAGPLCLKFLSVYY